MPVKSFVDADSPGKHLRASSIGNDSQRGAHQEEAHATLAADARRQDYVAASQHQSLAKESRGTTCRGLGRS